MVAILVLSSALVAFGRLLIFDGVTVAVLLLTLRQIVRIGIVLDVVSSG